MGVFLGEQAEAGGDDAEAGLTHNLARTLLPLDLRGCYFISQGALAHH